MHGPIIQHPSNLISWFHHRTLLLPLMPSWPSCCGRRSSARRQQQRGGLLGRRRLQSGVRQRPKLRGYARKQRRQQKRSKHAWKHRRLQKLRGQGRRPGGLQRRSGREGRGSWRSERHRQQLRPRPQHPPPFPTAPSWTLLGGRHTLLTQQRPRQATDLAQQRLCLLLLPLVQYKLQPVHSRPLPHLLLDRGVPQLQQLPHKQQLHPMQQVKLQSLLLCHQQHACSTALQQHLNCQWHLLLCLGWQAQASRWLLPRVLVQHQGRCPAHRQAPVHREVQA